MIFLDVVAETGGLNIHIKKAPLKLQGSYKLRLSHCICREDLAGPLSTNPVVKKSSTELIGSAEVLQMEGDWYNNRRIDEVVGEENRCPTCCSGAYTYAEEDGEETIAMGLLRSCSQIRGEAEHLVYHSNTFCFVRADTFRQFLNDRTPSQVENIGAISLFMSAEYQTGIPGFHSDSCSWDWIKALSYDKLQRLKQLRSLYLSVEIARFLPRVMFSTTPSPWNHIPGTTPSLWHPIPETIIRAIEKLRLCPIQKVVVSVGIEPFDFRGFTFPAYVANQSNAGAFPQEKRAEMAGEIRKILLDPKGEAKQLELMRSQCAGASAI
jgi:hypothetical protein